MSGPALALNLSEFRTFIALIADFRQISMIPRFKALLPMDLSQDLLLGCTWML